MRPTKPTNDAARWVVLLLVLPILVAASVLVACPSSSSSDDTTETGDATTADVTSDAPPPGEAGSACSNDAQCKPPAMICSAAGTCVAGCPASPCTGGKTCNTSTGRCVLPQGGCARDMECGDKEFCSSGGKCTALPTPGAVACAGGRDVTSACNMSATAAALASCAGAASSTACPYCRDSSCYWPLSWRGPPCTTDDDCHGGDHCVGGLCFVDTTSDPCPTTVAIADVIAGRYGSGKEVCLKDVVVKVVSESDGDLHVRMGSLSYPNQSFVGFVTEPTPQYTGQGGLRSPAEGETVRAHGMVRWDHGHGWWELHPVDWFGP